MAMEEQNRCWTNKRTANRKACAGHETAGHGQHVYTGKTETVFLKMNGKAGILRKIRNNILKNVHFYENILHI